MKVLVPGGHTLDCCIGDYSRLLGVPQHKSDLSVQQHGLCPPVLGG